MWIKFSINPSQAGVYFLQSIGINERCLIIKGAEPLPMITLNLKLSWGNIDSEISQGLDFTQN